MALPICTPCAKRRLLCPACEAKLSTGEVSVYDIEVSRILYELFQDEADFTRAVDTETHLIVLAKSENVGGIIGKGGANLRRIQERAGKPVRVIGRDDYLETAKALIAPARVREINPVLGSKNQKIRVHIEADDKGRLRLKPEDLRRLLAAVTEAEVDLVFD